MAAFLTRFIKTGGMSKTSGLQESVASLHTVKGIFGLFVVACQNQWHPVVVGGLYGLYLGSYYQVGDYMWIMATEKAPTENRASSTAAITMLSYVGLFTGLILLTVMLSMNISITSGCMIVMIPTMVLSMLVLMLKVKETKGTDLETVGQELA